MQRSAARSGAVDICSPKVVRSHKTMSMLDDVWCARLAIDIRSERSVALVAAAVAVAVAVEVNTIFALSTVRASLAGGRWIAWQVCRRQ